MWVALGHILPISVAVAISSTPIMATFLILLSPNRSRPALMFLVGWLLGLAGMVVVFTLVARSVGETSPREAPWFIAFALVLIGITMVVLGIIFWRRRPLDSAEELPKWFSAVEALGPWSTFALALLLNLRPKALLLSAAAGLVLRGDDLTVGSTAIVVGVYTVISASTVAGPIVATFIAPVRTESWLVPTRNWFVANNRVVSILIMIMVGVVVIGSGLTRL